MMVPVQLNNVERWALRKIAEERNAKKERHGVKTQKVDPAISDVDLHYIGLKAEYAVAKLMGLEIDIENTLEGDGGTDLAYRGLTLDVKFSTRDLKFRLNKPMVADVAILTQPLTKPLRYKAYRANAERDPLVLTKDKFAWANILVVGWISKRDFESECFVTNFGHVDCNVVLADNMRSMETLPAYAGSKKVEEAIKVIFK